MTTTRTESRDGVELAVMTSRLNAIVRNMMNTLVRTGRSGVLNTARDFSCGIITHRDELLVMAESLPIHMMSGPDMMSAYMKERHPRLRRGDAFLHNSPYHGNSHAADYTILVPVLDERGKHQFTLLSKAHQADCGNSLPTTYHAAAEDVYNEGALIFPCVKIQEGYRDIDDVIRMCKRRIRVPDQWWGDYLALLGAARVGERLLSEFGREVGWDTLRSHSTSWLDYSEQRMATTIRSLESGKVSVEGAHDPFPGVPDGVELRATVTINSQEGKIAIDLTDNPDCQPCGLNLTEATARTAALVGVFNSIDHHVPVNSGSIRRVSVMLRENCVVGVPRFPASCSVATTNLADRVTNMVQRGMAESQDGIGLGEAGLIIPPAGSVISGNDRRRAGAPFVNQVILPGYGPGPASPRADGWLTLAHAGGAGVCFRDSTEMAELRFPMLIWQQEIIPDSGGPGRYRGAPGSIVEFSAHGSDLDALFVADGNIHPARGARGGLDGGPTRQWKRALDGSLIDLHPTEPVHLRDGETLVSQSSGGGGYGPPLERDRRAVLHDLDEGWITEGAARDLYGLDVDHISGSYEEEGRSGS